MSIDTSEFLDVLMEDSIEALSNMEASLLEIGNGSDSAEFIDTIFRDAHSIKGGSGMLGLEEIAGFAHLVEALLDQVRQGERTFNMPLVGLLLECVSALRGMFDVLKDGRDNDAILIGKLKERLSATLENRETSTASESPVQEVFGVPGPAVELPLAERSEYSAVDSNSLLEGLVTEDEKVDQDNSVVSELLVSSGDLDVSGWAIQFVPDHDLFLSGFDPLAFVNQLAALGNVDVKCDANVMPECARINPELCYLAWDIDVVTDAGSDAIRAVFAPVMNQCELIVEPLQEAHAKQLRAIIAEQEATRKDKSGQDALTYLRETVVGEFDQIESQMTESAGEMAGNKPEQEFSEEEWIAGASQTEDMTVLEVGGDDMVEQGIDLEMTSQSESADVYKEVDTDKISPNTQETVCLDSALSVTEDVWVEAEDEAGRESPSQNMPSSTPVPPGAPVGEAEYKESNAASEDGGGRTDDSYTISACNQKIDTLINVAGELVFAQARLAQLREKLERSGLRDIAHLNNGLARLESDAGELQDQVISVLKT